MESPHIFRIATSSSQCLRCISKPSKPSTLLPRRSISTTPIHSARGGSFNSLNRLSKDLRSLGEKVVGNKTKRSTPTSTNNQLTSLSQTLGRYATRGKLETPYDNKPIEPNNPHHLHIYATKHNTHITLTQPNRNPIISLSTGNLGFKKAARGTYDAAYQLGSYVMNRIQDQGLLMKIQNLELVLRGFGPGREALTKIMLGSEGMGLRRMVCRVTDSTRLKFGGTRSPKARRLG
ncbi:hypothetical protein MMC14_008614 [Varicellaria rhodocarpa]|nr:hypothetical protein [Varicellaria rhodocarpa]